MKKSNYTLKTLILLLSLFSICSKTQAQTGATFCGQLTNGVGPFDARKDQDKLSIVLNAHFTADVESLRKGNAGYLAGDIGYTLRAIPNYPRALISMIRLGEREKTDKPNHSLYTIDCWLDRAIRFSPDDHVVRMIYASYLGGKQRKAEALKQLEIVKDLPIENPLTYYNLGMLYTDFGEYELALEQAHIAYDLGIQQPGLRERLKAAGKWRDSTVPNENPGISQANTTTNSK
jgi:tetratricopeptide (TPR) repeat protein